MRIGIMLRTLDEKFGIGMYTKYMLDALLKLESNHQYILHVSPEKIRTIYNGVSSRFRPIHDREVLNEVKRRYNLPDRFILTVGRYDPRENL